MAKVEQKKTIVEEITNHVKDAQCVVLVNYSGLTVEQDTILRKEFREAGIVYKVYKNTMMNLHSRGQAVRASQSICTGRTPWQYLQMTRQLRRGS